MSNFNLVLRTYTAMRQMTADDLALLGTLRALNDTDREKLIEAMSDKPVKKPTKKSAGKGGGGKSKHASSLQQQIQTARPVLDGGVSKMRCDLSGCGQYADANIHHLPSTEGYHEFAPPAVHAATGSTGD